MDFIKEHHHTLLVTLFLIGALFVVGSFEARVSDSAIAATTPGSQSTSVSKFWSAVCCEPIFRLDRNISILYTGDITKNGNLITSSTVLRPGDTISLTLIENAMYVAAGYYVGTPPAPWESSFADTSTMMSKFASTCEGGNSEHVLFIAPNDLCALTFAQIPTIATQTSGMNCGPLSARNIAEGIRELSTTCNITTGGPSASLNLNISPAAFLYLQDFIVIEPGDGSPHIDRDVNNMVSDSLPGTTLSWNIDVAPNPPPTPTLTFTGNPTTITQGQSATLTWSSQNTTSCNASNGWSGSKSTSGSENVTPPSTTTYNLSCQGAGGNVSSSVTITVNPACSAGQTKPHSECQSGSCVSVDSCGVSSCSNNGQCAANQPPVAVATINKDGGTPSDSITVTRGVPVSIFLFAEGSSDPDGWTHPQKGVSNGGKCEWNADLEQTSPTFEQVINNPASPGECNISLGTKTFNDSPGTYTYQVLKITDNKGAVSNIDTVTVNVLPPLGFSCNSSNQCVFGGSGASCLTNAGCPGGGGGGGCTGNCGGGGGGGGGGGANAPIAGNPSASQLGSDTSFFCPSHQVQLNWNYSDPNNNPQAAFRTQVDNNSDFSSMQIDAYKDTADHLYVVPADVLAFGAQYYFRVAVKDSTGAWSNWSSSANFTTPANCLVPDFALNSSNNITVNVTGAGNGTSNTTKITVTPFDQFASPVTLSFNSVSPALPGAVYSLVPTTLPSNQYSSGSTFKVTVPGTTAPGDYIITIKGEGGNPSLIRTVNVNLKVNSTSPVFREI